MLVAPASRIQDAAFGLKYVRMVIMKDCFQRVVIEEHSIILGIAMTTLSCRHAQSLQNLAPLSTMAMGRMLTAALAGLLQTGAEVLAFKWSGTVLWAKYSPT